MSTLRFGPNLKYLFFEKTLGPDRIFRIFLRPWQEDFYCMIFHGNGDEIEGEKPQPPFVSFSLYHWFEKASISKSDAHKIESALRKIKEGFRELQHARLMLTT